MGKELKPKSGARIKNLHNFCCSGFGMVEEKEA
jgi:hypothetical protein